MAKIEELRLVGVENHRNLGRDPYSKAIINTDNTALQKAREAKAKALEKQQKVENQEQRLNKIEQDVNEIKLMLKQLLSK